MSQDIFLFVNQKPACFLKSWHALAQEPTGLFAQTTQHSPKPAFKTTVRQMS